MSTDLDPKANVRSADSPFRRALGPLLGLTLLSGSAQAEVYPSQPVVLVVPFAAGGPADVIARIFAEPMSADLGQRVIIENTTGAGGTTGTARVAGAAPDGYTVVMSGNSTHSAALAFYSDLKYDPVKSFDSVGTMSTNAVVVVSRKDVPADKLEDFIAFVRGRGDKVTNGHGGIGSVSYSACVIFNALIGARPTMVAYRGVGPATLDMVAGTIDYVCDQVPNAMERIKEGSIKAYVVSSEKRQATIPDVRTGAEGGLPRYKFDVWYGLSFPKSTAPAIIARLNKALRAAQADPGVRRRIAELGGEIPPPSQRHPGYLDELIQTDLKIWVPMLIEARKVMGGQ